MFAPTKKSAGPPKPKPVKASYLKASALHYLSSRAASRSMLRDLLLRRSKRRLQVNALEAETSALIEAVLDDLVALGLLDDQRFAEGRRATLERKGFSKRRIEMGLKQKGLDAETIRGALRDVSTRQRKPAALPNAGGSAPGEQSLPPMTATRRIWPLSCVPAFRTASLSRRCANPATDQSNRLSSALRAGARSARASA